MNNLAVNYGMVGEITKSIELLEKVLEKNKYFIKSYFNLGYMYFKA